MHPDSFEYLRAQDGLRLRYGYWPCGVDRCRGTVVVLGGRTEFMEKYLETVHYLLNRHFDVAGLDWRGQGLSDRMLTDSTKGYVASYDDYISDLKLFLQEIVIPRGRRPLIVMAHSMGANIVLQMMHQKKHLIDKSVLLSPMIDIPTNPIPQKALRRITRWCLRLGMEAVDVPTTHRHDNFRGTFQANWVTQDPVRFDRIKRYLEKNSQLLVSSVTFGWLGATFDAIDRLRAPGFTKAVTTPVLMVAAGQDRVVSNHAICQMAAQLPACRLVTIDGAYHEILQELDLYRDPLWQAFTAFNSQH